MAPPQGQVAAGPKDPGRPGRADIGVDPVPGAGRHDQVERGRLELGGLEGGRADLDRVELGQVGPGHLGQGRAGLEPDHAQASSGQGAGGHARAGADLEHPRTDGHAAQRQQVVVRARRDSGAASRRRDRLRRRSCGPGPPPGRRYRTDLGGGATGLSVSRGREVRTVGCGGGSLAPRCPPSVGGRHRSRPHPDPRGLRHGRQRSLGPAPGLKRTDGHAAGEEALFDTVEGALELGIHWLTVYAFSTENWRRPIDEVRYLMGFNESILARRRDELHDRGVRMRFVGRRDWRVPKRLLRRRRTSRSRSPQDNRAHDPHHRLQLRRPGRDRRRRPGAGRRGDAGRTRSTRRPSAATSTTRTCPIPTWWCARRASTASPTSCCGSWPTASSCSPTCCGPTSAASTCSTAVREYQRRERRFGGIDG